VWLRLLPSARHKGNPLYDLRRQGNVWTGSSLNGGANTVILDNESLILTLQIPGEPNVVIGLTKNG
jgi:hypothetical protein